MVPLGWVPFGGAQGRQGFSEHHTSLIQSPTCHAIVPQLRHDGGAHIRNRITPEGQFQLLIADL